MCVCVDHNGVAVHLVWSDCGGGFENCSVSSAVDETGDDALWDETEEDGNVISECEEDEDTVCEDADIDTNWWR